MAARLNGPGSGTAVTANVVRRGVCVASDRSPRSSHWAVCAALTTNCSAESPALGPVYSAKSEPRPSAVALTPCVKPVPSRLPAPGAKAAVETAVMNRVGAVALLPW